MLQTVIAATSGDVTKAGKAIGLALGVGLGALGAGVGIGNIFASAFYFFEVAIVVSIQAFIFAALSAIYIGSAIEPEH